MYTKVKEMFKMPQDQVEMYRELLEALEMNSEEIDIALMLAEKEITMTILLSTLASFSMYEEEEDIEEEFFTTITNSILYVVASYRDMCDVINEDNTKQSDIS